jgi:chromosomal replication initiator protein
VGLGKTHLLHAIGNKFLRCFPSKKIKYVTSDEFSRVVYGALTNKSIENLKSEYEGFDLLLFDDIQFLSNKEKINEIFFNIFNNNLSKNKIIVLASDRDPKDLVYFDSRMKSRFVSGLLIKITKPDMESMLIILENKIKESGATYQFTKESLDYIVRRNSEDIRQLEGFLHQILFYASTLLPPNSIISLDTIKQIFNFSSNDKSNSSYDFDPTLVIKHVCSVYRISDDKVKSKARTKDVSLVRQVCMYVLREKFPTMSLREIGNFFGGRDHSTVIENLDKIKNMVRKDSGFATFIKQMVDKI